MTKIYLSVIIPVFNEENRVHKLKEIIDFFKEKKFNSEIIVVNDGSTDQTLETLQSLKQTENFRVISYSLNRGKGYALKQGVRASLGDFILFMDIDLSTPLKEFDKFKPLLNKYDLVIATRKQSGSNLIKRQSKLRETLGKGFTALSNFLLGLRVSDFTCGFKCFRKDSGKKIFSNLTIDRWGFDSEVLFLAHLYQFKIKEVPVTWENDPSTKVKFPQDLIRSLSDLIKIRLNYILGKYSS